MRATIIATVLIGIGIGFLVPLSFVNVKGMTPAAEVPTFAETQARIGEPAPPPPPETGENPERKALRAAVLHAARQLEFNPCSQDLRRRFVAAIHPFAEATRNGAPEYGIVNGKKKNVSEEYDKPAGQAIIKALFNGHIEPKDLASSPMARAFMKAQATGFPRKNPCAR